MIRLNFLVLNFVFIALFTNKLVAYEKQHHDDLKLEEIVTEIVVRSLVIAKNAGSLVAVGAVISFFRLLVADLPRYDLPFLEFCLGFQFLLNSSLGESFTAGLRSGLWALKDSILLIFLLIDFENIVISNHIIKRMVALLLYPNEFYKVARYTYGKLVFLKNCTKLQLSKKKTRVFLA